LFKARVQGVLRKSRVQGMSFLNKKKMRAQAKHVVVRVLRSAISGSSKAYAWFCNRWYVRPGTDCPNSPSTLVKTFQVRSAKNQSVHIRGDGFCNRWCGRTGTDCPTNSPSTLVITFQVRSAKKQSVHIRGDGFALAQSPNIPVILVKKFLETTGSALG